MAGKHSPGPWSFDSEDGIVFDVDGEPVATVRAEVTSWSPSGGLHTKARNQNRDARLIAAAPEVRERLEVLAAAWHRCAEHPEPFETCRYLWCPENRELLTRIDEGTP
jgi:hypothetical protein